MSPQTNESENGRSATKNLEAPTFGLLTRTLVRSGVVKQVIPARIRHRSKNDVLFISATSVTIKEALGNYHLKEVVVKDDFDSPIRSARILGRPREIDTGDRYNNIRRGAETWSSHHDWPVKANEDGHLQTITPHARELPPHILALTLDSNKLVFLCSVNGTSDEPRFLSSRHEIPVSRSFREQLGAHIAVDPKSRAMAIAAHEGGAYLYNLKSMDRISREVGNGMDLKPIKEERLIHVKGTIWRLEFLHPPQYDSDQIILLIIVLEKGVWKMVLYEWSSTTNIREWQLQGNRYSLRPGNFMPLLLIPLTKSATFMMVWEDQITVHRDTLTGCPNQHVQNLLDEKPPEEPGISGRLPLWIQWARPMRSGGHPYTQVEDAIYLCREDGVIQYLEFHITSDHTVDSTHQAGRLGVNVDECFAVLDVGPNKLDLLVAGSGTSEGGLFRVETRENPKLLKIIPNWTPLNNFISTNDAEKQTGMFDKDAVIGSPFLGQQRLFACTGRGKNGAIAELRHGFEASKMVQSADLGDATEGVILGIWAFHGFFGDIEHQYEGFESLKDVTYFVLAHPMRTSLIRMRLDYNLNDRQLVVKDVGLDLETPTIFESVQRDIGLDFSARTIYAGTTSKDFLVQITETSVVLSSVSVLKDSPIKEEVNNPYSHDMEIDDPQEQRPQMKNVLRLQNPHARYVAAHLHNRTGLSILLTAVNEGERFRLELGDIDTEYAPKGEAWPLQYQSSCVHLQLVENDLLAFVATLDGQLQIFRVGDKGIASTGADPYEFDGDFAICESITVLKSSSDRERQSKYLVVCGLRNGSIHTLHCTKDGSCYNLGFCENVVVGSTSVTVLTDVTKSSRIIFNCDGSLCVLEYPSIYVFEAPATIHNLWITDRDQPALQQGMVSPITQVVEPWLHRGTSGLAFGSLICVDTDLLHMLSLDDGAQAKMVPRRIQLGGTPLRVTYSAFLDKLIILYEMMTVTQERTRRREGQRRAQHLIKFVDVDDITSDSIAEDAMDTNQEDVLDENDHLLFEEQGRAECFIGITEWFPEIDGKQYHLLVVNTKIAARSIRFARSSTSTSLLNPTGRLLIFAVSKGADGYMRLSIKKTINLRAPAYSVAAYPDRKSLIYCSGNDLCIQSISSGISSGGWPPAIKVTMRSFGQSFSINEPYIYVSSVSASLMTFKYTGDNLIYQFGDQSARNGLHHISIPEHSLVLASDKTSSVIGLWQPPGRRIDNAMATVFEAILPSSITNLHQVTCPIWYRDLENPERDRAIIGSSADGTLTQFEILFEGTWRLLRFIQNMAERSKVVCPFVSQCSIKRHMEPSTRKPYHMHVNGDILQRVLERGGEGLLKEMLDAEPDYESLTDFDSAEARWNRCKELAAEIVDTSDDAWLAKVVYGIRRLLQNAL